jgi:hypothetical protein
VYGSLILKPGDLLERRTYYAPGIGVQFYFCGKTAAEGLSLRGFLFVLDPAAGKKYKEI